MADPEKWKRQDQFALTIFFAMIFSILLAATWNLSTLNTKERETANQRAREYSEYTHKQIEESCVSTELPALQKCVTEKVDASHEYQRAERDLVAQEAMARWAFLMLYLTLGGLAVTGIGIYFVRENLEEMKAGRKVSEDAVKAAQDANAVAREIGEAQVRAYLTCEKGTYSVNPFGIGISIESVIQNNGQSPAMRIKVTASLIILKEPLKQGKTKMNTNNRFGPKIFDGIVLSAGNSGSVSIDWNTTEIDPELIQAIRFGKALLIVEANIDWGDVFNGTGSASYLMLQDARTAVSAAPQDKGSLTAHNHTVRFTRSEASDPTKHG